MSKGQKIVHMHRSEVSDAKDFIHQRPLTDTLVNRQIFAPCTVRTLQSSSVFVPTNFRAVKSCLLGFFRIVSATLRKLVRMGLSPLRKVVLRTIEVHKFHRETPEQFVINDQLECGHVYTDFQWSLLDLVNPYSEVAGKKRHRCHECAEVIAKKRPQSVGMPDMKRGCA